MCSFFFGLICLMLMVSAYLPCLIESCFSCWSKTLNERVCELSLDVPFSSNGEEHKCVSISKCRISLSEIQCKLLF